MASKVCYILATIVFALALFKVHAGFSLLYLGLALLALGHAV